MPYNGDLFSCLALLLFSRYKLGPTHAVIQFEDEDTTAVVPLKKIRLRGAEQVKLGCCYEVKWTDSKIYKAAVHALGIYVHEQFLWTKILSIAPTVAV